LGTNIWQEKEGEEMKHGELIWCLVIMLFLSGFTMTASSPQMIAAQVTLFATYAVYTVCRCILSLKEK